MNLKQQRRATRRRTYTILGAVLIMGLFATALASMHSLGRRTIGRELYPFPHKTLQALVQAQRRFWLQEEDPSQRAFAPSLRVLEDAGYITPELAQGSVEGYRYTVEEAGAARVVLRATPEDREALHYYADESEVVRAARGGAATSESQVYFHPAHGLVWREVTPEASSVAAEGSQD